MTTIVDLTLSMSEASLERQMVERSDIVVTFGETQYTGTQYEFSYNSMVGTYIDFPGHIVETDDGMDAENYPLEKLVDVPAAVIHLDRESRSGAVTASELQHAAGDVSGCDALIINALGARRFDEIQHRSVWFDEDAIQWILRTGAHLFVSDIYERSPELTGIFRDLFAAGISTVCNPVNLHLLDSPRVELTVLPLRFTGVTQLPCRAVGVIKGGA